VGSSSAEGLLWRQHKRHEINRGRQSGCGGGPTWTTRCGSVSVAQVGSACIASFLAFGEPRGAGAGARIASCEGFFLGGDRLSSHSIALTAAPRRGAAAPIGLRLLVHHP